MLPPALTLLAVLILPPVTLPTALTPLVTLTLLPVTLPVTLNAAPVNSLFPAVPDSTVAPPSGLVKIIAVALALIVALPRKIELPFRYRSLHLVVELPRS